MLDECVCWGRVGMCVLWGGGSACVCFSSNPSVNQSKYPNCNIPKNNIGYNNQTIFLCSKSLYHPLLCLIFRL